MGGFSDVLGALVVEIEARFDEAGRILGEWETQIDNHVSKVQEEYSKLSNIGSAFLQGGAVLTAGITAPLTLLATESIKAAGDMESLKLALDTVTGSSSATAEQMTRLNEIAKLPGLSLESAVKGTLALQNVGLSAQESERYIKAFGNAIAAAGGSSHDLEAVVTQLRQMGATGKVTAEDLKPILERVPQVAAVTKAAFGTISSEVIGKAGIGAQEFLNTVVGGLEKIPPVTGGIKNAMENMSDSMNKAMVKVGEALMPFFQAAMPLVETFVGWIGRLADWFKELPGPVQNAVVAFTAILAVLGPLIVSVGALMTGWAALAPALTTVGALLGTTAIGLLGWAAAIAAAVAALVALGAWVNENWDSIVAVVSQAWDGLTEAWSAVWDGIGTWFQEKFGAISWAWENILKPMAAALLIIWDPMVAAFQAVWSGIGSMLAGVWNGIKELATSVWGSITSAVSTFLEWAQKIPGVNKLFNLDEAWNSAKRLDAGLKDTATATQQLTAATTGAVQPQRDLNAEVEAATAGRKAEKAAIKASKEELKKHNERVKEAREAAKDHAKEIEKARKETEKQEQATTAMVNEAANMAIALNKATTETKDLRTMGVEPLIPQLKNMGQAVEDIKVPLNTLGITSAAKFQQIAADAQTAYNQIVAGDSYSQWEKDSALLKLLEAQRAAMIANGEAIPKELDKMLEEMNQKTLDPSKGLPKQKGAWENFGTEVSTIITNFTQDIAKSLFDGDTSWGEKAKGMLKSLGEAVFSSFVQPATAAIAGLINGALKDLLSGKYGLGDVFDGLKKIGDKMVDIFKAAPGSPSAPSSPSSPGGNPASGLSGWVSAIGSVGTMVSSIVGNFQMKGMNASLGLIEESTRFAQIHLGYILDTLNTHLPLLWATVDIKKFLEDWNQPFWEMRWFLQQLDAATTDKNSFWGRSAAALEAIRDDIGFVAREQLPAMIAQQNDQFKFLSNLMQSTRNVNVSLYGTDPKAVGVQLATLLNLQGGVA